jgi:hypothetical protein
MKTRNTCIKKSIFHHQNHDIVVTFCFIFLSHKSMSILARLGKHTGGKTTTQKSKKQASPTCLPSLYHAIRGGGSPVAAHCSSSSLPRVTLHNRVKFWHCEFGRYKKGHPWPLTVDISICYLQPLTIHNRVKIPPISADMFGQIM